MNEKFIILAIDGGAASGKSTTAMTLTQAMSLMHVDTGSHYRALCLKLLEKKVSANDERLGKVLGALTLDTEITGNQGRIRLDGKVPDPDELRSDLVNEKVSFFAAQPDVREKLLGYQQSLAGVAESAGFSGLVMEGRDIGSVIYPEAQVKIFLQADERERKKRREAEGQTDAISLRDKMDTTRKNAPLACPDGALVIDTGRHSIDQVVGMVLDLAEKARS